MSTIPHILGSIGGLLIFLFLYWKRLKEDYTSDILFTSGFLMFISAFVGGALLTSTSSSIKGIPNFSSSGLWFWGGVVGLIITFCIVVAKFKMRFFETLEASGVASLPWVFILLLIESIRMGGWQTYLYSLSPLVAFILFLFLDGRYKKFAWYKSGKVGFAGLTSLAIFFLIRAPIAIISPNMVSFIGKIDAIASAVFAFLLFFTVYNLSELE